MSTRSARYTASSTSCVTWTMVVPPSACACTESKKILELRARKCVDRRKGLVEEDDRRSGDECTRDGHPLLHTTRELPWVLAPDTL